jgi:energy-coupling factor transporter ATP-binding protein EcfA2
VWVARVFVSHASEDLALACEVHQWLTETGHEVFLDRDVRDGIALGERWRERLWERLRWADAVVCVVTSAYLASTWCTAEVVAAQSRGGRLLVLRVEADVVHPLLSEVQYTTFVLGDLVAARAAVAEALRRIDAAGGAGWSDDRCPFPGLRPFDVDWHRVFFGRTEETKQLVELLRSAAGGRALLVVGPSGCGKSSLVRAGLLPVMADEPGWRTLPPILPGADPVRALARELAAVARRAGLDWTVEHVHQRLTDSGLTGVVDELLLADPSGPQRRLLVVVDQVEELLTQSPPDQRDRFVELLGSALSGPVHVVGAVRPEFLDQLLSEPGMASLSTTLYPLRPLRREALRAVIEKPAGLAGIDLDEGLVDRLVEDTDSGDALPLLAFTLAQLADGVTRGEGLSGVRYDQLGGVQGALTRHADAALAEAVNGGGRSREEVLDGLLRLVTVDEQGRPTRWRIPREDLPTPVVTELDAFVTRRLLTTDTTNDIVVIGVAHEAFLSAWPPLAQAITENASALRARRAVEQAATQWHDNGYPHERLWGGGQLAVAVTDIGARICAGTAAPSERYSPSRWWLRPRRVLVTDRVDISPRARDFLHTSIRRDRFRRRRAITVLSVLLCAALIAAGIAVNQQHTAQQQLRAATARQLITHADNLAGSDSLILSPTALSQHRHLQELVSKTGDTSTTCPRQPKPKFRALGFCAPG